MPLTPRHLEEHIRCRLYLYCVLAAIPKMLRKVPSARAIVGDESFSLQFATRSGLKATLRFNEGEAVFEADANTKADISLFFLSDRQVNKLFSQKGVSVPLPVRGWGQMHKLKVFKEVADTLQFYLKPTAQLLKNPHALDAHVNLLLGLVVRALGQLARHEPESIQLLKKSPQGLATFRVNTGNDTDELEIGESAWISYRHAGIECGFGTPPQKPDVCVSFRDPELALKALNDQIDVNAEVGMGTIRVQGLIPLADNLGYLMQRVPHYLDV